MTAARATDNLRRFRAEVHIIGKDQRSTDLPVFRHMRAKPTLGRMTLDRRARGLSSLYTSSAAENLRSLPAERRDDHRDIPTHRFAHPILFAGLSRDIYARIEAQRQASPAGGLRSSACRATNAQDFFARPSMRYFGNRGQKENSA